MTVSQLKRSTDRRFDRMDRRFDRLERTKVDKTEFRAGVRALRNEIINTRRYVDRTADTLRRSLRDEIARTAEETRRHFDVVAEGIHETMRVFADAIASHSDRLEQHETRITVLERRSH